MRTTLYVVKHILIIIFNKITVLNERLCYRKKYCSIKIKNKNKKCILNHISIIHRVIVIHIMCVVFKQFYIYVTLYQDIVSPGNYLYQCVSAHMQNIKSSKVPPHHQKVIHPSQFQLLLYLRLVPQPL